jgi:hypothetical protein
MRDVIGIIHGPRLDGGNTPSFLNSVWERTWISKLCFAAGEATELPRQRHSQTEFGNETEAATLRLG